MAKVLLKFKEAAIREIPLVEDVTRIGRKADNDIVIDNQAVSGYHARIKRQGGALFIEDMNSLNGTYINGQKISKAELHAGDVILIGVHTLDIILDRPKETDSKGFAVRGRSMDETVVMGAEEQKKILASQDKDRPEIVGGFIVIEGSTDKRDYLLKERVTTIGKEDGAGIRLKGWFAPQVAALVNRRKDGYFITPASGKSLKVNGQKVDHKYDLKDGDVVEAGGIKVQFYIKE
ncbi:MAG TPA: FHA domain-containing protein [Syntrophales bacterium]|nr:FHA domain-containing protein [Syntrophales bacterium]